MYNEGNTMDARLAYYPTSKRAWRIQGPNSTLSHSTMLSSNDRREAMTFADEALSDVSLWGQARLIC